MCKPIHGQWKYEAFNEMCTLSISYTLILFTEFQVDSDLRYIVGGYTFIGIFALNIVVNLLVIIYKSIHSTIKGIKLRCKIWKLRKIHQQ